MKENSWKIETSQSRKKLEQPDQWHLLLWCTDVKNRLYARVRRQIPLNYHLRFFGQARE